MNDEIRITNDELPASWALVKLSDVGLIVTGTTPSTKNPKFYGGKIPFVKPRDLDSGIPITKTKQMLTVAGAEQSRLLKTGAIMVSCIGNLGKVGIAGVPVVTNQQINSIEFDSRMVVNEFGGFYCSTLKPWMEQESSATTIAILNKSRFSLAPFPLAPLAEQKRIADKLEAVLGRVDACRARLDRVPALLKRFRQSVLANATSGGLTAEWRMTNGVNDEWENTDLLKICSSISDGDHLPPPQTATGIPFLTIGNISSGKLDFTNVRYVPEPYFEKIRATRVPKSGDTLYSVVGASIGIPVMVELDRKFCFQRHIAILKPSEGTSPGFLHILMASPEVFREAWSRTTGTAQPTLPLGALRTIPVSVPTLPEQQEIVRRVEDLFAFADRIEARLATAQKTVERLTPATLAKAFRGELVPQDPSDEPASVLFDRPRTQPAAKTAKAERTKRK